MKQDTLYLELKEVLQQVKEDPQKVQLLAEKALLLSQKHRMDTHAGTGQPGVGLESY